MANYHLEVSIISRRKGQGKYDQEPTTHISRIDFQKEQRGERTPAGDKKRSIKLRNENSPKTIRTEA